MPAFTLVAVAVLLGLVVGTTLVIGAPYLALPIVAIAIVVMGLLEFRRRRRPGHGTTAGGAAIDEPGIQFDERDRETLLPSEGSEKPGGGG